MNKRAVAYIRVSTAREGMISPELQLNAIEQYCRQMDYEIKETLEDLDKSGRLWGNRQVEHAVKMIERGEADVLVVWKISRVARSLKDWVNALDRVEGVGGQIESATEPFDDSSVGAFSRSMIATMADFESKRIAESWKETHARRIKMGLPHHGLPRFGYTYSRETGYLPDPESGPVLAEMYRMYVSGHTLRDIAAYTSSVGYEPEGGWHLGTLGRTLDRGFGAGFIHQSGGQLLPGRHEPVVPESLWQQFQVRRGQRNARPRADSSDYAYSGLLRCHCGERMAGGTTAKGQRRYACNAAVQRRTHKTNTVAEKFVEEAVLGWLQDIADEMNARARAAGQPTRKAPSLERQRAKLEAVISKNANRLDSLLEKYLDKEFTTEEYNRAKAKYAEDKATAEASLKVLEVNSAAPAQDVLHELLSGWSTRPPRGKRALLGQLVERIQLHDWPDGVRSGRRLITVHAHWE